MSIFRANDNEANRAAFVEKALAELPKGLRILDAGAGELRNKPLCAHLDYVSQDFCQYDGVGDGKGLQTKQWQTGGIDVVSDITRIPLPDGSFDAVLCSEVLEHLPEPTRALDEFSRLLKPGGRLILTAPFNSLVHFAPYHYSTGFSRYWYEHHLPARGFRILTLVPNGDWFALLRQEAGRLGRAAREHGSRAWPLAYAAGAAVALYFAVHKSRPATDWACFGWHCISLKE